MFGPPGIAYVYLVYGMYDCLNVVTGPVGDASALLIRAIEPIDGVESMRADRLRRGARRRTPLGADARTASGPGLVGAAMGLDRSWTGVDLCDAASPLRLEGAASTVPDALIRTTPRIGIGYAGEAWVDIPWRFSIAGHPSVSGPRAGR